MIRTPRSSAPLRDPPLLRLLSSSTASPATPSARICHMTLSREWVIRGCLILLAMQAGPTYRATLPWQTPANTSPPAPQTPANQTAGEPPAAGNASPSGAQSRNQTPGNATPGNATPGGPPTIDPGAATFVSAAGMMLVTVKPDKTADYEAVITALQEALARAEDEETRTLAAGWRVYKAIDLDAKANAIYIHVLDPLVTNTDYRPSLWLDKLLGGAPAELLAKYRDSFGAPPTKLSLTELAHMSVAPVPKPANTSPTAPSGNATPDKPANATPAKPSSATLDKPGNATPRR
jgi:hypothetical protein